MSSIYATTLFPGFYHIFFAASHHDLTKLVVNSYLSIVSKYVHLISLFIIIYHPNILFLFRLFLLSREYDRTYYPSSEYRRYYKTNEIDLFII